MLKPFNDGLDIRRRVDVDEDSDQKEDTVLDNDPDNQLLKSKLRKGKRYFLVKWTEGEPTWEPSRNVSEGLKQMFHSDKYHNKKRKHLR